PHRRERDAERRDDPPRRRDPHGAALAPTRVARRRRRSRTVFETASRVSGRIRVVDYRAERRLVVNGEILSVYPLDGDWSRVRRDYWALALGLAPLVAPRGALVVNRHRRAGMRGLARVLRARFGEVRLRHVRRGGENVLIDARSPLRPA